jgi:zinc D-Ala-D-Ala carboxypeptidase
MYDLDHSERPAGPVRPVPPVRDAASGRPAGSGDGDRSGGGRRRSRRQLYAGLGAVAVLAASALWAATAGLLPGAGAPAESDEHGGLPDDLSATPFDTHYAAVANLDPALLEAVQAAANDAAEDGIHFIVRSGWRSKEHQQRLLDRAVVRYGGLAEARKFVATPETSAHVTGKAVDIWPTDADDWLIRKGAKYGICQVYANEMWHFELLTTPGGTCPPLRENAAG